MTNGELNQLQFIWYGCSSPSHQNSELEIVSSKWETFTAGCGRRTCPSHLLGSSELISILAEERHITLVI